MARRHHLTPLEYAFWIGKVVEKISGKPFKSGKDFATVKDFTINPQHPQQKVAFTFEEDDTVVCCEMVRLAPE
jgi:hypothetical protein